MRQSPWNVFVILLYTYCNLKYFVTDILLYVTILYGINKKISFFIFISNLETFIQLFPIVELSGHFNLEASRKDNAGLRDRFVTREEISKMVLFGSLLHRIQLNTRTNRLIFFRRDIYIYIYFY